MDGNLQEYFRTELSARKQKLEAATAGQSGAFAGLLGEVDRALQSLESGDFGLCESCHEPIEQDRLLSDPLVRLCLDHLTAGEQRALEDDLKLAASIQQGLLPRVSSSFAPWEIDYLFEPARIVSGDYCDLIPGRAGEILFLLGDVSGKGVAASMLMSHLHGMFRTLASLELPLPSLMERAGRMFCESTLPSHYVTLISGRTCPDGTMELCNAGHLSALVVRRDSIDSIGSRSLPLGLFCDGQFESETVSLLPGESLVLFTDGITEAENDAGDGFGQEALRSVLAASRGRSAGQIVESFRVRLQDFLGSRIPHDDRTLLVLRYQP